MRVVTYSNNGSGGGKSLYISQIPDNVQGYLQYTHYHLAHKSFPSSLVDLLLQVKYGRGQATVAFDITCILYTNVQPFTTILVSHAIRFESIHLAVFIYHLVFNTLVSAF